MSIPSPQPEQQQEDPSPEPEGPCPSSLASAVSSVMERTINSGRFGSPPNYSINCDQRNLLYPTDAKEYSLIGEIGRGATAVVYMASIVKSKFMVAIKRINLEKFNVNLDELLKEIQVMCQSNHDNVVRFYTSFVVHHELWLVMKLLDGGSLLDVIKYTMSYKNCINGVLDELAIASVLKEVLKGLDYFHSNGHIHRDIKAGNILLATDGSVKIADFGVSAFIATSRGDVTQDAMRHTFVGTPCWMAPEVMDQTPCGYDTKADIWSCGILALELATGTAPYHKYPPVKVLVMTLQNDPPTLDTCEEIAGQYKQYGRTFRKMVDHCLQKCPSDRLTAKQLLKHEFFKKARDKQFIARWVAIPTSRRIIRSDPDELDSTDSSDHSVNGTNSNGKKRRIKRLIGDEWMFDDNDNHDDQINNVNNEGDKTDSDEGETVTIESTSIDDTLSTKLEKLHIENLQSSRRRRSSQGKQSITSAGGLQQNVQATMTKVQPPPPPLPKIQLSLRLRNHLGQLNDIKFHFDPQCDTCDLVTNEMVSAGLVQGVDRILVAYNMAKIMENPSLQSVVFALPSHRADEMIDHEKLIGCAMWFSNATPPVPAQNTEKPQTENSDNGNSRTVKAPSGGTHEFTSRTQPNLPHQG